MWPDWLHSCRYLCRSTTRRASGGRLSSNDLAETFLDVHGRPHPSPYRSAHRPAVLHLLLLLPEGAERPQTAAGNRLRDSQNSFLPTLTLFGLSKQREFS